MRDPKSRDVVVLGGGSWGTALAVLLHSRGHNVAIWELIVERAAAMRTHRENKAMLPGIHIHEDILITPDIEQAKKGNNVVVFVVPSHGVRDTTKAILPLLRGDELIVITTKGIEEKTLKRMSEVVEEVAGVSRDKITTLVGPSHAEEVSRGVPTTVVAASETELAAKKVQDIFMTPLFRVYTNTDVIGVETGVALKNVVAIAAGMCDGLGYGDNTKGALLTRGLAEMTRLGVRMGAHQETYSGLSGIGDLITTCTSKHSRNRYVGQEIGKGRTLEQVLSGMIMVAEGVRTTRSAVGLSEKHGVEMPIAKEVYKILFENKPAEQAMRDLMLRSPKPEIWW
jgi:glycerol-3-phosphate dehydrogenase (NAD(P)+)